MPFPFCCFHSSVYFSILPPLFSHIINTVWFPSFSLSLFPTHSRSILLPSLLSCVLMSGEMWSRDHSETGRHSLSSNSHHSSIIHTRFISLRWGLLFWSDIQFSCPQAAYGCIYFDKRHLFLQLCRTCSAHWVEEFIFGNQPWPTNLQINIIALESNKGRDTKKITSWSL